MIIISLDIIFACERICCSENLISNLILRLLINHVKSCFIYIPARFGWNIWSCAFTTSCKLVHDSTCRYGIGYIMTESLSFLSVTKYSSFIDNIFFRNFPLLQVLWYFSVYLTLQKNKICLWHLGIQESMERDEMDDGLEPALKCEADHNGDVTGLEVSRGVRGHR